MASFNASIDLLALNGAQVFTDVDPNNPTMAYVCVPVDLNEIKITTSRQNADKQIAGLRVNIWPLNENYKAKVRQSALERGDSNVNVPTHEMQQSFTTDYIKQVAKAFPKLVEQVREQNKDRDPGIMTQDPQDESTHLFKAIRNRMNKRIAMVYQPQTQTTQQSAYPQNYAAAGTAQAYVPPTDSMPDYSSMSGYNAPNSDLPF